MLTVHSPPHLEKIGDQIASAHPQLSGRLFATSGSSAVPKWVWHQEESLNWCAEMASAQLGLKSKDTFGLALPSFHVGGFGVEYRARLLNAPLRRYEKYSRKWQPELAHHWLTEEKITVVSLVPTQIYDFVQANLFCPPHLRIVLVGGEHLPENLLLSASELNWPLISSYGMTETAGLIAASQIGETSLQVVPGWQVERNPDGLLSINSPGIFSG